MNQIISPARHIKGIIRVPGDTRNRLKAHPPKEIAVLRGTWEEVLELEQSTRPMEEQDEQDPNTL